MEQVFSGVKHIISDEWLSLLIDKIKVFEYLKSWF